MSLKHHKTKESISEVCPICGMTVELGEYHPHAACLMYRGCHDAYQVRLTLRELTAQWREIGRKAAEAELGDYGE